MKHRTNTRKVQKVIDAAEDIRHADRVKVEAAAEFLGVIPRRVRNFINPECQCVLSQRKKRVKFPKPDPNHKRCGGTGRLPPKLHAIKVGGAFWIRVSDLFEYAREVERKTGRPRGKSNSDLPDD